MLTNTKKLAFTSKSPGKTSEFNFFAATGSVGQERLVHKFTLVDVPGVGYAEVCWKLSNIPVLAYISIYSAPLFAR